MKSYNEILNESENFNALKGDLKKEQNRYETLFEMLARNIFKNPIYMVSDKEYYFYKEGYVETSNVIRDKDSVQWLPANKQKIAENIGVKLPNLKLYMKWYNPISKIEGISKVKNTMSLGVPGVNYVNFHTEKELEPLAPFSKLKSWGNKAIKDIQKQNKKELKPDIITAILNNWTKKSTTTSNTRSSDIGIGSHASTTIYKDYNDVYNIKGMDTLLGLSKDDTEKTIKKIFKFKRDTLHFDWKKGEMYVGGTSAQVWD